MNEKKEKRSTKENVGMILETMRILYRLSPKALIMSDVGAIFRSFTPFVNIYMSAKIIDEIAEKSSIDMLIAYVLITIVSNLLIVLINQIVSQIIKREFKLLYDKIGFMLSNKALETDYQHIENVKTRVLRNRIEEAQSSGRGGLMQCFSKQSYVLEIFCKVIIAALMSIEVFSVLSEKTLTGFLEFMNTTWASISLAVIILILSICSGFSFKKAAKVLFNVWRDWPKRMTLSNYYSNEYIGENGASKDIRLFNQKHLIETEMKIWYAEPTFVMEKFKINCKYDGINLGITSVLTGLVYFFVAMKVVSGAFGLGSLVMYAGLVNQFVDSFVLLICETSKMILNNDYMTDVFEYLNMPRQMNTGTRKLEKFNFQNCELELHNVTFRYPNACVDALKDISLKITPGKSIALVGMNGSGKTTLIKLLCRLYDPTEGKITLNGIDIREYDYIEYQKVFSVVFQDFKLFAFELGQNVAAGMIVDPKKVEECLSEAGFEERLKTMENGIQTYLYKDFDEKGVEISGGEGQKIALARALYKEAPVIVLDEPTAALDPLAEAEIYSKFNEITQKRTTVYISHRLSSCQFCDEIVVLDKGCVVQSGSHERLLEVKDGKYFELWNAQAQYYI